MALKIKCNYTKTSNIRYPYAVKTQLLRFQFSNKRDAERFCKQRTKNLKNLYICIIEEYSDAVLAIMHSKSGNIILSRALDNIQYFIENPDYREDCARYERVCALAVVSYVQIYSNLVGCKRLCARWEKIHKTYFAEISKPFCEGKVLITRSR